MSYVRWGKHSDVYVYEHVGGFFDCCGCKQTPTAAEMIEHLREHVAKGDTVPEYVFENLAERERRGEVLW